MKKFFTLFLTLLFVGYLSAQNISVASFELDPLDVTANLAGTIVLDQNGEKCALLRIKTTQMGFQFDVGMLGVQKTEQKTAEIWVYVPRGVRKIAIRHQQLGECIFTFPISIEPAKTYIMHLTTGKVETIVHNAVTSQYVLFRVTPPNAIIEFDDKTIEAKGGTATERVPFGTYHYRIHAPRYTSTGGTIEVNDPKNKHIVTISLEPQFATFTFNAPNNSEIWVNEQKRGVGSCTIELSYGTYMVETRLPNHRGVSQEVELNKESNHTIQLKAPTPIYGSLDINTIPADADIYWDNEKIGTTPLFLDKILVGNHKLKLVKKGYTSYEAEQVVSEGELLELNIELVQIEQKPIAEDYSPIKNDAPKDEKLSKKCIHSFAIGASVGISPSRWYKMKIPLLSMVCEYGIRGKYWGFGLDAFASVATYNYKYDDIKEYLICLNFGGRTSVHFNLKQLNTYVGFMAGADWKRCDYKMDPAFVYKMNPAFMYDVYAGLRYYFGHVGLGVEFRILNFSSSLGITYKF